MVRASDGATWIADSGCSRLIRIAPDGTPSVFRLPTTRPRSARRRRGGRRLVRRSAHAGARRPVTSTGASRAWPASRTERHRRGGRAGRQRLVRLRSLRARSRPTGRCLQLHARADPRQRLAFDPAGGLWLASAGAARADLARASRRALRRHAASPHMRPAWKRTVSLAPYGAGSASRSANRPRSRSTASSRLQGQRRRAGAADAARPGRRAVSAPGEAAARAQAPARRGQASRDRPVRDVTDGEGNIGSIGGEVRVTRLGRRGRSRDACDWRRAGGSRRGRARPLGSRIAVLVAGPDGGAWVLVERGGGANAIGRAMRRRPLPHDRGRRGARRARDRSGRAGVVRRARAISAPTAPGRSRAATLPAGGPRLDRCSRPGRTARCGP